MAMVNSFYFYDLETTGVNPRESRPVQFAGQRTDLDLKIIDEPHNIIVKLSEDILPDPDAVLVTGITPQQTIAEGITEAEFLKIFHSEISVPGTIFVGYNNVRFDDEFMRFLNFRNFYDPYEWQWKEDRSRWDLLDVVRLTRALRPEGIKWPFAPDGKPSNRLELLTSLNKLDHANAHDALSDVMATIDLAKLLRTKQPKLFDYLLTMRDKKVVGRFVEQNKQFVYASGKYSGDFEKTTVAIRIADTPKDSGALVYDLRFDPTPYLNMSPEDLVKIWQWQKDPDAIRLPIKTIKFNRCPAIAPVSVLDSESQKRIKINLDDIARNQAKLAQATHWPERLYKALDIMDKARQSTLFENSQNVDASLYDGFLQDTDKRLFDDIHNLPIEKLTEISPKLRDKRLQTLLPLYKARNFPKSLTDEERAKWEAYKQQRLFDGGPQSRLAKYFGRIEQLSQQTNLSQSKRYALEDLRLYGESLMPTE